MLQRADYAQTAGSALPIYQRHFVRDAGVLLPMHSPKSLCGKRHIKDPILTQVRSVLIYDDVSKGLILPFKHGDRLSLTPLLSQLLRPLFDAMASDGMIIMPVPLHKARYFSCRYNQSAELARNLSASSRHNAHIHAKYSAASSQHPLDGRPYKQKAASERIRRLSAET
jgi:predicted amidophosphoribosyltransferase